MYICIGIDVHARKLTAFSTPLEEGSEESAEFCEAFNRDFRLMSGERKDMLRLAGYLEGTEHSILIESGTKTHEVFWTLTDAGCTVVVANARDLFRISKSVKKTDFHDCEELAHYMRRYLMGEREFSACLIVDQAWMNRRQMCRIYSLCSDSLSDLRRRIRSYMLLRSISSEGMPRDIASGMGLRMLEEVADEPLRMLIRRARFEVSEIRAVHRSIEEEFEGVEEYEIIKSVPGFGVVTSSYLCSMIVDVGRFSSGSELAAYFGIVPKQRESADHAKHCGITHRGDERARSLLVQATLSHITHDKGRESLVSRMYDRLRSRGMPSKKALTACACKMAKILYVLLRDGKRYEPRGPERPGAASPRRIEHDQTRLSLCL